MRTPQPGPPSTGKRRHRPRRARPATLTATLTTATAVAAALAGCSSQPPATTATSASARPATVVTIPTAPTAATDPATPSTSGATAGYDVLANMPPAAKQHTNAGAQAFVRYYIEAYGRLLMDPAKGQLPKLEDPQCPGCKKLERIVGENADAGRVWADIYFRTLNVGEPDVEGEVIDAATVNDIHVMAPLTNSPVVVHEPSGLATTRAKSSDVLAQLWLSWRDGQWYVTDFQDVDYTPPKK